MSKKHTGQPSQHGVTQREEAVAVPFEREDRYIVLKIKDLERLNPVFLEELTGTLSAIANLTTMPRREYVVVESDWPEYELVWKMLEARVNGERSAMLAADKACREPVEYQIKILGERWTHCAPHLYQPNNPNFRALYTNPQPAQQPLTKQQCEDLVREHFGAEGEAGVMSGDDYILIRATEAAHGIVKDQK